VGATVSPGDYITYRFYFRNTGSATQTNVMPTVAIPANTTFVWQGGGTDTNGQTPNCQGDGRLCLYWNQSSAAPNVDYYVDYRVQVNANAADGASIYSQGAIASNQVSLFYSNRIDNMVTACPTFLNAAPNTSNAYTVGAYDASGKRVTQNTVPICVSNYGSKSYFVPAATGAEIESFKANKPSGVYITPL
jgi:uncharacterized repeat protein (TIGR01451 family)